MASGCSLRKDAGEIRAALSDLSLHCIISLVYSKAVAVQLSPVVRVERFIRGEQSGARSHPSAPALQGSVSDQRNKTFCFKKPWPSGLLRH